VAIVKGLHPIYDLLLLSAAREWKYQPATRDGKSVTHVKRLAVTVNFK
jgi:hypothetical protein